MLVESLTTIGTNFAKVLERPKVTMRVYKDVEEIIYYEI